MKHDLIAESRKPENLSCAAATGKVLSHYDVLSKVAQHLQGASLPSGNHLIKSRNHEKNLPKYCQCYSNLNSNK